MCTCLWTDFLSGSVERLLGTGVWSSGGQYGKKEKHYKMTFALC